MESDEIEVLRRGIALTVAASMWAIGVSTVDAWRSPATVWVTAALVVLAVVGFAHGLAELERRARLVPVRSRNDSARRAHPS